jgi:dihydroflavonol-4-reductase
MKSPPGRPPVPKRCPKCISRLNSHLRLRKDSRPTITPTLDIIESIMLGAMRLGAPTGNFTWVDARDVAEAHILAAEKDVTGRFVVSNDESPSFAEFSRVMHDIDPAIPAAPWTLPPLARHLLPTFDRMSARVLGTRRFIGPESVSLMDGRLYHPSNARARRELGWAPTYSLPHSLAETIDALRTLRRAERRKRMA